jgi:hypothetical protein
MRVIDYLFGVSSFLVASGAVSVPFGVLDVAGAPGTLEAPGVGAGLEGVAGGPIGAEPDSVPSFFGNSAPGALVPGCDPGTGRSGLRQSRASYNNSGGRRGDKHAHRKDSCLLL